MKVRVCEQLTDRTEFKLNGKTRLWYEPPHHKTNKMTCAPSKDSDQPGHPPSLIRVFAVCSMGSWGPNISSGVQWRLIRLGGCPGWCESSLGTQVILLVLSWGGSIMFSMLCKPVWAGWAPVQDPGQFRHFPANMVYQTSRHSLNYAGSPCQTAWSHQGHCLFPVKEK